MEETVDIRGESCRLSEPDICGDRHAVYRTPLGTLEIRYTIEKKLAGYEQRHITKVSLLGDQNGEFKSYDRYRAIDQAEQHARALLLEIRNLLLGSP